SLVAPFGQVHELVRQRLCMELRLDAVALVLPRGDVAEVLVVALRLAVGGLVLEAEVAAAGLVALEGVQAHELAELEEVRDAAGELERLVHLGAGARHAQVLPELLAQPGDLSERVLEALLVPRHPAVVPHDLPELAVEGRRAALSADSEEPLRPRG